MAIEFKKADVAQRKEPCSPKAVLQPGSTTAVDGFKFTNNSPHVVNVMEVMPGTASSTNVFPAVAAIVQKHKERLAYNAAYQRDLRTIKRLGLNCTVAEYRNRKDK